MIKKTILLSITTATLFAADGSALLEKNCASCHLLTKPKPEMIPTLKAPAIDAVAFHIKAAIKDKEEMKKFIIDYVQNPAASKSICESNKVAQFGVMPSLKGKVSSTDLEVISSYILEKYPSAEFVEMITQMQRNDTMRALVNSPFLINKTDLPHLTKLLMQNWDKASLGLSQEQKKSLLVVRKETLSTVKKIKKQTNQLEKEIVYAMISEENPKTLDSKVDQIAKLKAEATKAHLKCIYDTLNILEDEQISFLLPFSDY
jgi:hypothetical protein